jgi:hypothetical protein
MPPDTIDRLSGQVYAGLREGHVAASLLVELACELVDRGSDAEAARDLLEQVPARMSRPRLAALARRLLAETGFDPGFDLAPERLEVLRRALRVAARDLPAAGITGPPRLLVLKDAFPPAAGVVLADGQRLNGCVSAPEGDDPAGAVAAVARHLHEGLMDRTRRVWPVCPRHRLGAHVLVHGPTALWWCAAPGGGHALAPVGQLSQ